VPTAPADAKALSSTRKSPKILWQPGRGLEASNRPSIALAIRMSATRASATIDAQRLSLPLEVVNSSRSVKGGRGALCGRELMVTATC
jgi:hypothetical protein